MTDQDRIFMHLPRRGLAVSGQDAEKFLQGIITNDINLLQTQSVIYACILTHNGKFMHDFFIYHLKDQYILDLHHDADMDELVTTLKRYRLRTGVQIEPVPLHVIAGFGDAPQIPDTANAVHDPRDPRMGWRAVSHTEIPAPEGYVEAPAALYDERRIHLRIPEPVHDAALGASTLEELRIPDLNGVSFTKGCYLGQELTARMENRGLGKKHLYTVRLGEDAAHGPSDIYKDGAVAGNVRSRAGNIAIALIRDEAAKGDSPIHLSPIPNGWEIR